MTNVPKWRIRIYEFLAAPAHAWILLCATLLGLRIEFGPDNSTKIDR